MPMRPLAVLALLAACGGKTPSTPSADDVKLAGIAASVTDALDTSVDPCDDFYRYACGGWEAKTEIPSDQSRWSRSFSVITQNNLGILRGILDEASAAAEASRAELMVGTAYGACMDEEAIEAAGATGLADGLAMIASVSDVKTLVRAHAKLARLDAFFGAFVGADFEDPDVNTLHIAQSGLGLPEKSYYAPGDDALKQQILADYEAHIAKMLVMIGQDEAAAAAAAKNAVAVETALAEVSRAPAEMRDVAALNNPHDLAALEELVPWWPWKTWFTQMGAPQIAAVNVMTPEFFDGVKGLVDGGDWQAIRDYLTWQYVHAWAGTLSDEFVDENFGFFGRTLSGQSEITPRWKRCVRATDGALGDLLGQVYVDREFGGDSKAIALEMITQVEHAFEAGLPGLAWMDEATRVRAKDKLDAITNKIGYPDKWETYDGLELGDAHLSNVMAWSAWGLADDLAKVGQPVDPTEWFMSAPTVNAYYNPSENEIVFPAGILQPPFFSADFPTAMNFGAMGMVMGHEITHGFDDEGRKFGPDGKLEEWWAPEASERFESAAQCVDDLYSGMEVQPELFVNGRLTLGENIADFGGIKLAHRAYQGWLEAGNTDRAIGEFTGEQTVFLSFAQGWCYLSKPELEQMRAATDPHAPPRFRVNGPLSQYPAFGEAFGCEVGSPMRPAEVCEVW